MIKIKVKRIYSKNVNIFFAVLYPRFFYLLVYLYKPYHFSWTKSYIASA